jgi:GNAT superfamily N-acetyltransferase
MPASASQQVTVADVRDDGFRRVPEFYRQVLAPSFAPDELLAEEELLSGLHSGRSRVLTAVASDGTVLGGTVGEYFPRSNVVLLAYLATLPGRRGGGVGSALLRAARDAWTAELSPRFIALEVEDPRDFTGSEAFGDPVARVRFYEGHGVRALPLPYMQPALSPVTGRVPGLMLMVLRGGDAPAPGETLDGQPVAAFLTEYFAEFEGPARPGDAELELLLAACAWPGGLPLLTVSDLPASAERKNIPWL